MFKRSWLKGLLLALLLPAVARADEGMWLPLLVKRLNQADMQKKGLKLTAEEIYDVNNASLKDAVVQLGGFCTGEFVSGQGLLLTNHHCGYDAIQSHSTPQKNLLADGFYAANKGEELKNPGLFVDILVRMEDVTGKVLEGITPQTPEAERVATVQKRQREMAEAAKENGQYVAYVRDMFAGNEYYLFVYQRFGDVRLVGAPPESVGKFGGDTDNWMWPRHTADFSMFRVYADKNNKPTAGFQEGNQPYVPKKHLPVSLQGVAESDFAMVFGFPGRTQRFLPAAGLQLTLDQSNPARIKLRDTRLKIWKEDGDQDPALRLKYASKYANIANYWKYFIGQNEGMKRLKTVDQKTAEERTLMQWIAADAARGQQYGSVLNDINQAYATMRQYNLSSVYMNEAALGTEILTFASRLRPLYTLLKAESPDQAAIKKATDDLQEPTAEFFKDYSSSTDKKVFAALLQMYYNDVPKEQQPDIFQTVAKQYGGSMQKYADEVFGKSFLTSEAKTKQFLQKPTLQQLENDPAFKTINSLFTNYQQNIAPKMQAAQAGLGRANRLYVAAMREKNSQKVYSPDANSTIRLSYGTVRAYQGRDAVRYNYFTTAQGILEKEDATNPEFVVPKKQIELLRAKDYGRFADKDGTLHTAFITDNDITGGNSGSPVINGRGELIGLAFDGNWEAMTGDLAYDPELKRCINADIRYVLWCIEKLGGAKHIVDEMTIVNNGPNPSASTASAGDVKATKVKMKTKKKKGEAAPASL
ncbi:S46 family peptidase [Hymenobacter busanensis]|uniref:Dipeptidyl-peptidase n=1 Tax=Hymenobacter busanensis TaxID=2607656 RepID=A0A7L4ZW39_9BACT|nr:S46 family peptidase [Hymenobacter busanensis]KAA9332221.1 S46 family peptidase [Hymenobacter busanensis]QHJ07441.1 serine protease [Hymenobacter busanensis]